MPSVSGKTHLERRSETWFNSGYGLYMTHRLAREGGNFVLVSGRSAVELTEKNKTNCILPLKGTGLRINIDLDRVGDIQNRLSQFREEGMKEADSISGSAGRPPSGMSLILRRNFRTN